MYLAMVYFCVQDSLIASEKENLFRLIELNCFALLGSACTDSSYTTGGCSNCLSVSSMPSSRFGLTQSVDESLYMRRFVLLLAFCSPEPTSVAATVAAPSAAAAS